jgi:hypothetical protein
MIDSPPPTGGGGRLPFHVSSRLRRDRFTIADCRLVRQSFAAVAKAMAAEERRRIHNTQMNRHTIILVSCLAVLFLFPQAKKFPGTIAFTENTPLSDTSLDELFLHPPDAAKPWVVWYWMQAAASKEGITADLEAMKQARIGGAYMMFIKGVDSVPLVNPPAQQLSPHWWELVMFAIQEAKRLNIQLGMHVSDGFALAGGPWIKPEMSMQRVVSSKIYVEGKLL